MGPSVAGVVVVVAVVEVLALEGIGYLEESMLFVELFGQPVWAFIQVIHPPSHHHKV